MQDFRTATGLRAAWDHYAAHAGLPLVDLSHAQLLALLTWNDPNGDYEGLSLGALRDCFRRQVDDAAL